MILRPRQKEFVTKCLDALYTHGNTLGVASTGFGKSLSMAAITCAVLEKKKGKCAIICHRDEINSQNNDKFLRFAPKTHTSFYDGDTKSWSGNVIFAMAQTLSRPNALENMPPLSMLVIDECHRSRSASYESIIAKVRENNKDALLLGVTATVGRSDGKGLRSIFSNIGDQVTLTELIRSGHLVPPKSFVIDLGVNQQLADVRKTASDFDMGAVAEIMDKSVINAEIIRHWKEKSSDRKTVIFCSTVAHSQSVAKAFQAEGIKAACVWGEMQDKDRTATLKNLERGDLQVVTNPNLLTEGWDCPPVSCVVLLRPCSHKSTVIQQVGRGLRVVDPEEYPHIQKTNCLILDFGISLLTHQTLEQDLQLEDKEKGEGEAPTKICPECEAILPIQIRECPFCGHIFESKEKSVLENFQMSEIDIFKKSNFKWIALDDEETCMMACGFTAWAGAFYWGDKYFSVGGIGRKIKLLGSGERVVAIALGEDHLNNHEDDNAAHKTKRWLREPATEKQLSLLGKTNLEGITKYRGSCLLNIQFNKQRILDLCRSA